jgi:hypothetical protein
MRIILPENISERISEFLVGKLRFPFVESHEIMCIFFLYGKSSEFDNSGYESLDLATKTVNKFLLEIESYKDSSKTKMNTEFIRNGYFQRELQIRMDVEQAVHKDRIVNDPIMLASCFMQHLSYHNQEFFFQIYGPLKRSELLKDLRSYLEGRTIMLGFNRKDEKSLPFQHPILPLYVWLRQRLIEKK